MRHITFKRIIAPFLLIAAMMTCILPGMEVMAANPQVIMTTDTTTVSPGNVITLSLQVATNGIEAAAFSAKVEVSTVAFSVVKVVSNLDDIYYGDERKNQILFNWYSSENITFDAGEAIMQLQLRASAQAELATYEIKLSEIEFYDISNRKMAIELPTETLTVTVANIKSEEVLAVETLIDAIGTVEVTTETLDKITDAQSAFSALNASDKAMVENYLILQNAIDTYNRLKEEQVAQESQAAIDAIIKKFRTDHAEALALTTETVTIADQTIVEAGVVDYLGQDAYIRKLLKDNEYKQLLELKAKISSLIAEENAFLVAQEQVTAFHKNYQQLLEMTTEQIPSDSLNYIQTLKEKTEEAMVIYREGYNSVAQEILKEDYNKICALYEEIIYLEKLNAPDEEWVTEAYNAFRNKYLTLLLKSSLDVTEADIPDIQAAISELKEQRTAVKGKLMTEYEHLMNLLDVMNSQQLDTDAGSRVEQIEKVVERITEKIVTVTVTEEDEKRVQVLGVDFTSGGFFGLLVFVINLMTMILFMIPFILGYGLRRRKEGAKKHAKE